MKKFSLLILLLIALNANRAFSGGADDPVYQTFSGRVYGYNTALTVGESFSLRIRSVGTCKNYKRQEVNLFNKTTDANSINNSIICLQNNNAALIKKSNFNKKEMFQTMWGGTVGLIFGAICGGGSGLALAYVVDKDNANEDLNNLGTALSGIQFAVMGAMVGGCLGNSIGVQSVGKKHRKGSFWVALAGAVVPTLAASGISAMTKRQDEKIILYTWLTAPITSTAAYYIFSKDKSDTLTPPKQ